MAKTNNQQPSVTDKTLEFFSKFHTRRFKPDEIIIRPDTPNDNVYLIVKGRVKKYSANYKGDDIILTIFHEGSFIPIANSIGQSIRNRFYYSADTEVEVRVAPKEEVTGMLVSNPDIMLALLHRVNRGLDEFLLRTYGLMAGTALSRVAYEIYTEASRFGIKKPEGTLTEINERAIASRCGLTRETVNREIRKLKNANILTVNRGSIAIHDMEGLEKRVYKNLL